MSTVTQDLYDLANIFRIQSIEMVEVTQAGHPTSCSSMAEIIATLFFHPEVGMKFDPQHPRELQMTSLFSQKDMQLQFFTALGLMQELFLKKI